MRLLWVKAGKLLPVDTGGKICSYNLLKHLAARHQVVLLSYYGGGRDEIYESAIRREFDGAQPIHDHSPQGGASLYVDYARRLLSPAPYAVAKFTSRRIQETVRQSLSDGRFDVAVCDFLSASRKLSEPVRHAVRAVPAQRGVGSLGSGRHGTNPT
jgi:polysaccharide biosynthesis protein PslH